MLHPDNKRLTQSERSATRHLKNLDKRIAKLELEMQTCFSDKLKAKKLSRIQAMYTAIAGIQQVMESR